MALPNRDEHDLSIGKLKMALEPRISAPGKARRAASKGKPRRAAVAKATAKSTAKSPAKAPSKSAPRKATGKAPI